MTFHDTKSAQSLGHVALIHLYLTREKNITQTTFVHVSEQRSRVKEN